MKVWWGISPPPWFKKKGGVPWSIALNLTYAKTVTPYNIERWTSLFLLTCYLITLLSLIICS